jgi:hypothetical protein
MVDERAFVVLSRPIGGGQQALRRGGRRERPGQLAGVGVGGELVELDLCLRRVAGPNHGGDALHDGHAAKRRHPHGRVLVLRSAGVASAVRGSGGGPPLQVPDQLCEHTQRLPDRRGGELPLLLEGRIALQRLEQGQPGQRCGAEGRLTDAGRQVDRLVGAVPDLVPLPAQQLGEGQSREGVQHDSDRAGAPAFRQDPGVAVVGDVVVAEVDGGVAEVGHDVRLGSGGRPLRRVVRPLLRRDVEVGPHRVGEAGEGVRQAS